MQVLTYSCNKTFAKSVQSNTLIYLPEDYGEKDRTWSLLIFLHGSGERGNDLDALHDWLQPTLLDHLPPQDFITVAPQCPTYDVWGSHLDGVRALMECMFSIYPVNQTRVYLMGVSMGGAGVWQMALRYPTLFAAIAPICPWGGWRIGDAEQIRALSHIPIRVYHGAQDEAVPLSESEELVNELIAADADVKLNVYPEAKHDVWTQVFAEGRIFDWFIRHRLES